MSDIDLGQLLTVAKSHINRPASRIADISQSVNDAEKVGRDFESFFVTQMLESMSAGLKTDGMFGGGHAEGIYRSMMNQEYGKAIIAQGGFGIAQMITEDVLALQEQANQ